MLCAFFCCCCCCCCCFSLFGGWWGGRGLFCFVDFVPFFKGFSFLGGLVGDLQGRRQVSFIIFPVGTRVVCSDFILFISLSLCNNFTFCYSSICEYCAWIYVVVFKMQKRRGSFVPAGMICCYKTAFFLSASTRLITASHDLWKQPTMTVLPFTACWYERGRREISSTSVGCVVVSSSYASWCFVNCGKVVEDLCVFSSFVCLTPVVFLHLVVFC